MAVELTDMQLLHEYAFGASQKAFAKLVERRIDLVYSAALRQVRQSHLAQDVTQAVFVVLARKSRSLDGSRVHLAGWLLSTTHRVAMDALRKLARRRKHERKAAQMNPEARDDDAASGDALWQQLLPHLDSAIARLREGDRAAIVLRYFEEKSMREVAEELGVTEAAAKQRVFRAVEKLRKTVGGQAISATAIGAAISAHAVKAAPAGLAKAAAGAACAGAHAAGVTALAKGAIWVMAMNQVKMSIAAIIVLAIVVPAAVVTYKFATAEPQKLAQAAPTPKPSAAPLTPVTTAAATAPAAPVDWRVRFAQVYHLDQDQTLARIAPPYIPERQRYLSDKRLSNMFDFRTGICVFQWENGQAEWNHWSGQPPTVENVLRIVAGLPRYRIQMDDFDRMRTIEGDWVIRKGVSEAECVAAISRQLQLATEWPVHFELKNLDRDVFVAQNKFVPTAAPERPGQPPFIQLYLDTPGKPTNHNAGNVHGFLVAIAENMDTEIIDETGDSDKEGVFWTNHVNGGVAGPFREKLLKHVTDQTGITFTAARRPRPVWVAVTEK